MKLAVTGAAAGVGVAGTGALEAGAGAAGAGAAGVAGALEGFTGVDGGFAEVEALAATVTLGYAASKTGGTRRDRGDKRTLASMQTMKPFSSTL